MPPRLDAGASNAELPAFEPVRLARADRREALLDAALELVAAGDVDGVSIESVADRAGVSRPLVYKHFANRTDILSALYARESDRLHRDLSAAVAAAGTIEDKYRALFHGSIRAARERGPIFEGLRSAAGRNGTMRSLQRSRDRQTVAAYAKQTMREIPAPPRHVEATTVILLGAITSTLSRWHEEPTDENAALLEDAYMRVVNGALAQLRQLARRPARRSSRRPQAS